MNEIRTIPHSLIDPSPLNPRRSVDDQALAELAASIRAEGLLQNLVLRPGQNGSTGRYEIAAGERRYRAIASLIAAGDLPEDHPIPAVVRELTDLQLLTLATTENMARADMHPLDEARAFARMLELGSDVETIALETGLSVGTIRKRLALVERLAPAVQEALAAGEVNLGQAQALAAAPRDRQVQMLESAPRMSPANLRDWIARDAVPVSRAVFPLDRYTGSFTQASPFDTQGEDTFDDVAQFHELQAAHVEHLRAEYAKRWAWVEVVEYHNSYRYDTAGKRDGPKTLGVVLEYRKHTGELTVHEDLKKRPEPERYGDKPTEKDPLALTKAQGTVANQHRTRALQAAFLKDGRRGAVVALCVALSKAYGWEPFQGHLSRQAEAWVHPDARAVLKDAAAHHPNLDPYGRDRVEGVGNHYLVDVTEALLRMDSSELDRLFIALVGTVLRLGHEWNPFAPVDPAAARIADEVGASDFLPTYRQLGVEYLLMYSKPKLEAVAEELCGSHARSWAGLSRKVIAANVFAHIGADLDQVPSELRMASA